jgi:hypothetical protein
MLVIGRAVGLTRGIPGFGFLGLERVGLYL